MRRVGVALVAVVFVFAGCARGNPSVEPSPPLQFITPTATPAGMEAVSFPAADGERLTGQWWYGGRGPTVVVMSNMGDNNPEGWEGLTGPLTERGYPVLTYSFRYPRSLAPTAEQIAATMADLRGAIAFAQSRGATRLVLIGASLGGMATAKVAGTAHAVAVVIIASPPDLPEYRFTVEASELAALTMPKLFASSVDDSVVPLSATKAFYDAAPRPKELKTYEGNRHGLQIFGGPQGWVLSQDIAEFLALYAAP